MARNVLSSFVFRTDEQRQILAAQCLQAWFRGVKTRKQLRGEPFGELRGNGQLAGWTGRRMPVCGGGPGRLGTGGDPGGDRWGAVGSAVGRGRVGEEDERKMI